MKVLYFTCIRCCQYWIIYVQSAEDTKYSMYWLVIMLNSAFVVAACPTCCVYWMPFSTEAEDADEPSLLRFMCAELTRGYFLEHNEAKYTEQRERVYTCMRVPKELEKVGCTHTLIRILPHNTHTFIFSVFLSFSLIHQQISASSPSVVWGNTG